ncbi:MAG: hypothetical protein ACFFC3_05500 [Candidatus Odinarchaeota archaeon]
MIKKIIGVILIIIGSFLIFGMSLTTLLFVTVHAHCIPDRSGNPDCPSLDPLSYFNVWFSQIGWFIMLTAIGELLLIIDGIKHFLIKRENDSIKIILP